MIYKSDLDTDYMIGYRIKLYPTIQQKQILDRNIELYRWVYNWALETIQTIYKETGKFTRDFTLYGLYDNLRKDPNYAWLKDIPLATARNAILCAVKAYINFFEGRCRYPKFKSKRRSSLSFGVRGERVYIGKDGYVSIEGMGHRNKIYYGSSSIPKEISLPVRIYSARVTYDKDDYWLSFQIQERRIYIMPEKTTNVIGIDVGVKHLATLSDGTVYDSPNLYKENQKYKRLCKKTGKIYRSMLNKASQTRTKFIDIEKSKNLLKLESKVRKQKRKLINAQQTAIHTITKEIVNKNPKNLAIESLDVAEMICTRDKHGNRKKDYKNTRSVVTAQLGFFFKVLSYKAKERGINIIKAPSEYPSSQLCSNCGYRQRIGTSRIYTCPECGISIDRDLNAAINLKNYAISLQN